MKNILTPAELAKIPEESPNSELWTTIIPAAGAGKRLNSTLPKALFPVLGRPLVSWMIELFKPFCTRFVFVVSPAHSSAVEERVSSLIEASSYEIVVQEEPRGMADAVDRARSKVATPFSCVAWVDQISLRQGTVRRCMSLHEARDNPALTMPTILKKNPYIHFKRDDSGRIVEVLQSREGEIRSDHGENDCGLFMFTTKYLFQTITEARKLDSARGRATGEFNLLPLIPRFQELGTVVSVQNVAEEETLGVNTPQDAAKLEELLRDREGEDR